MEKLKYFILALIIFPAFALNAQSTTVTGVVKDDIGELLPGVSIIVEGTTLGTTTNFEGEYSIEVPSNGSLVFSYVGYVKQTVQVQGRSIINITLKSEFEELDQVVVIGYGTVKKSDLTGSVVSLSSDDLNSGVNANVNQMLQGRAPGVQVYQNSSEPGGGLSIQIRGVGSINASNEPLYVIDGLPMDNEPVITGVGSGITASRNPRSPLNSLNPSDIKSIEILKDASATAIYGSRGANGVIMISTKRGIEGKLKVNYDSYYGIQNVAKRLDVLSATEYQQVLNELYDAGASNASVGERVDEIQGDGTNWQDELFREAPVQNHNLSLAWGTESSKYYVSLNYFNQDGVVISSGIERFSLRTNVEHRIKDKFNFGINMNSSLVLDDYVINGIGPNENGGAISAAFDFDPTLDIFDETGRYSISPFITKDNPLAIAHGKDSKAKSIRLFGTVYGEYFFMPSLSVKLNIGGDIANSRKDVFVDSSTKGGLASGGIASIITAERSNYVVEGTINYNKEFGTDHRLNAVAGITTQKFYRRSLSGNASGFISEATRTNSIQSGDPLTYNISSSSTPSTLLSYLGRANYSYKDKFLFTATFRADGSSRFGENNKFSYFPSAAIGWKMENESFIEDIEFINNLKLRASWGQTGNQAIPNFRSLTTFSKSANEMVLEDTRYIVFEPTRVANPDLKWETTTQTDIGVDFQLLNRRLSGSIDYFYRKTEDLLMNLPVPTQTGFTSKLANVGSVENKGWEFLLNVHNLTGELKWNTSMNLSLLKNEIIELGPIDQIISGGLQFTTQASLLKPGESMNSYYGYEVLGVWQTNDDFSQVSDAVNPGDWKYNDLNGDGSITASDRKIIGSPLPDLTWGMTNDFSYKRFTLSAFIQGVHGVDLLNNQLADSFHPINFRRNKLAEPYLNRWTPNNPTNEYASFMNPNSQGFTPVNTRTVEDASYIRLQNVTIGYDAPVENTGFFHSLNIYVTGSNLLTITNYSGLDPGTNITGTSDGALRIDYNAYPLANSFIIGVRAGF